MTVLIEYLLTFYKVLCMRMQSMQPMTVLCLHNRRVVKTQTRTHNNEYGQVPMVTDLHMRPVIC
jgi:hypothetical protein